MSLMQRNKGKRWERAVADALRLAMPGADIRRGWQSRSGSDEADVICPLYWIECKCGKQPNPRAALRQAQAAAPKGKTPIVFIKQDRAQPYCFMAADDLTDIHNEITGRGEACYLMWQPIHGKRPHVRTFTPTAGIRVVATWGMVEGWAALPMAAMLEIIKQHWRVSQE